MIASIFSFSWLKKHSPIMPDMIQSSLGYSIPLFSVHWPITVDIIVSTTRLGHY
jgi:hypothetical protein